MKMKIKWGNVIKFVVMILSLYVVMHDTYEITINNVLNGKLAGFTIFGLITFCFSFYALYATYDSLFN